MTPGRAAGLLAAIFAVTGSTHLLKPEIYDPTIPDFLPGAREIVLISGVAELALAAGLVHPRTRGAAGWVSAAFLVAVFPANVQPAIDAFRGDNTTAQILYLIRLPLQLPLIWLGIKAARTGQPSTLTRP